MNHYDECMKWKSGANMMRGWGGGGEGERREMQVFVNLHLEVLPDTLSYLTTSKYHEE